MTSTLAGPVDTSSPAWMTPALDLLLSPHPRSPTPHLTILINGWKGAQSPGSLMHLIFFTSPTCIHLTYSTSPHPSSSTSEFSTFLFRLITIPSLITHYFTVFHISQLSSFPHYLFTLSWLLYISSTFHLSSISSKFSIPSHPLLLCPSYPAGSSLCPFFCLPASLILLC